MSRVAIVGGGVMGLTIAHRLAGRGHEVVVYEAGSDLGGLAAAAQVGDYRVDRYYHVILASDGHLMSLLHELSIFDRMRWGTTKMAFFHEGRMFPMSTVREFFSFPPLSMVDRVRLAWTLLRARLTSDWRQLDAVSLEEWLGRLGGARTYEHIWRPLIASKFDGDASRVPATYMWSRIHRMTSTRKGVAQKEAMGYLVGGYETLAKALAVSIREKGGQIHLQAPVQGISEEGGRAIGVQRSGQVERFDAVVVTASDPVLARLLPDSQAEWRAELEQAPYLGVACLLLVLDRSLSEYYTINLTDRSVALTGIIETTTLIDPELVGGHLVYLPRYCRQDSPYLTMDADALEAEFLGNLRQVFPEFREAWILERLVSRTRMVEPIHEIMEDRPLPPTESPLPGLYVANTRRIYPALHNCEAVIAQAERATSDMLESLDR